jgi:hypothetical protein
MVVLLALLSMWSHVQVNLPANMPVNDGAAHLDEPVVAAECGHAIHELLEVQVQVLKHKVQPPVSVDDVMQPA